MAAQIVVLGSLVVLLAVLAAILGAVESRERVVFVIGIAAFIAVHGIPGTPETTGMVLAVVAILVAVGATVPLLRASP